IIIKHFIDSISIAPIIKKSGVKIIDVGTGAGFPGIPIKIVYPDREIKLLDSLKKRLVFLNEIINNLGLVDISTVHCRAEDAGKREGLREMFDVSTARAVAALPVLLEYCLPLTKVGGYFIAMKGSNPTEVEDSKRALDILGAKIEDIKEFVLPFSDYKRNVVIIRKFRQTPTKYPRKSGKPSKDPLM
ncbi:MAG: 16S rRNA (guanine(527)-N(7))-methyltransferase RsmG, partial [Clostridium sp.]|nr:16S rRNA (guanine(527)-N(7))-methyltransferase RsmG [Clostridium sp.]